MEDEENLGFWGNAFVWFWKSLWFVIILSIVVSVLGAIFGPKKYEGQTAEEWFNDYDYCVGQVEEANTRIEDANSNIYDINSKIDDAQYCSYGGCDFEEMQSKISDLEKAETIEQIEVP